MGRGIEPHQGYLTLDQFLAQYSYVQKVYKSCTNESQRKTAKKWAEDWSIRMERWAPLIVKDRHELYKSVTSN